ncbi:MAG: AMIN domain-containing protein, partial [Thermodesulfobacteriota bacterium]|nr:AMIN domain-containing protein [Thermodesulfobacteriota bacterium]
MSWGRPSLKTILVISFFAFGLLACGGSDVATRSGEADRTGQPEQSRPAVIKPMMTKLSANVTEGQTRIVLNGSAPLTYTSFMLTQPPVIIVDVSAKAAPSAMGLTQIKNGTVEKIEVEPVSGNKKLIRVRISLDKKTNYKIAREGSQIVVMIDNPAGTGPLASAGEFQINEVPLTPQQTSGGTAEVVAVDFKPLGQTGRTRLVIKTSKLVKSRIRTKDQGRTLILSLQPARISQHLARSLDTSFFKSAVNYIRPAPAGGRSVRFLIKLRQAVPYHLGEKGVITYLDFDPSAVQPKAAALSRSGLKRSETPAKSRDIAPEQKVETKVVKGGSASSIEYKGQKISLDFQNADIHNIIRLIGEVSGKNVVVSDKVTGKVTLKLKDVPWDQALDIILAANQLGMVETGNVLRVDKLDILRAERERLVQEQTEEREQAKDVPLVKKVLTPRYAAVAVMKTELEKL